MGRSEGSWRLARSDAEGSYRLAASSINLSCVITSCAA
jgi:hypothetical protein